MMRRSTSTRALASATLVLLRTAHAAPGTAPQSTAPQSSIVPAKDDDGEPRLSLPTAADRVAWQSSGFRLGLGVTYGDMRGIGGAPSGRLLGPKIQLGLRLDERWSILSTFQYQLASSASTGLSGLRFAGTLDPTWHIWPSLALAFGVGFGGLVDRNRERADPEPHGDTLDTSYTFPDARTPLGTCDGIGVAGLVRLEWSYVLGPRAATGVALEVLGQWTGCVDDTDRIEPDTGAAIVRRQWWPHAGVTLGWGMTWR
jgi:hypothetical protein